MCPRRKIKHGMASAKRTAFVICALIVAATLQSAKVKQLALRYIFVTLSMISHTHCIACTCRNSVHTCSNLLTARCPTCSIGPTYVVCLCRRPARMILQSQHTVYDALGVVNYTALTPSFHRHVPASPNLFDQGDIFIH